MSALVLLIPTLMVVAMSVVLCCDKDTVFFGGLYVILTDFLPKSCHRTISLFPGGPMLLSCCGSSFDYVVNKPNPLMQIFYLGLVIGGFSGFVYAGLPLIPNARLGSIHIVLPFILVLWVLFTFVLASIVPPGFVTKQNVEVLEALYPYDGFIFVKRPCETCGIPRIGRSKHCRMLNKCVDKYDHFCPWINNTVGALNYRYFLLFVGSTMAFLVYGTYVLGSLLVFIFQRDRLWEVRFMNTSTNHVVQGDWMVIMQYMFTSHGLLIFVFVLCLIMGITLVGFFIYQLFLIRAGTTANESSKWADVKDFYNSKKWQREVEERKKVENFPSDAELIRVDADPLNDRVVKDFPSKMPVNIYNKGFLENMKDVIWPESERRRRMLRSKLKNEQNKVEDGNVSVVSNVSNATKTTTNGSKKKKNGGKKKN